jgi:DNA gyrase subunit B
LSPISTATRSPCTRDVIYVSGEKDDGMAEIAMQWNDSYNEVIVSFANNIHTPRAACTRPASRPR